ncbi:hypothetical protein [Winogradskyella sp. PE311]|uniref:hypothetical protein n=1 Tax=Winogradskyella sp. PE311 TaxID=3366943 RepID=UPI003980B4AB
MIKFSDFLSQGDYLFLPSKNNCKVVLNITNQRLSNNSYKLYNPFSLKGKIFKSVFRQITFVLNKPIKLLLGKKHFQSSAFIIELQKLLDTKINSSLYIATAKDKVVLQLQNRDNYVIGYVKFSLNNLGNDHIKNEVNAIQILIKAGIVDSNYLILTNEYKGSNYCVLKNLEGTISSISEVIIQDILKSFKRKTQYTLALHPRVLNIRKQLELQKQSEIIKILDDTINDCKSDYRLVYEHGDFAEWNIIKIGEDYRLFDFEYFVKDGLEYLDLFKFYFQKASLLAGYKGPRLVAYLEKKINLSHRFKTLFIIFLIKEISLKIKENKNSNKEYTILKSIL